MFKNGAICTIDSKNATAQAIAITAKQLFYGWQQRRLRKCLDRRFSTNQRDPKTDHFSGSDSTIPGMAKQTSEFQGRSSSWNTFLIAHRCWL